MRRRLFHASGTDRATLQKQYMLKTAHTGALQHMRAHNHTRIRVRTCTFGGVHTRAQTHKHTHNHTHPHTHTQTHADLYSALTRAPTHTNTQRHRTARTRSWEHACHTPRKFAWWDYALFFLNAPLPLPAPRWKSEGFLQLQYIFFANP